MTKIPTPIETTPPAAEPLELADVKLHMRIDHDADDDTLNTLIKTARQMCEESTGLALITRGYSLFLDAWPANSGQGWWDGLREGADTCRGNAAFILPRPPLAEVTQINIYDANDDDAAFAAENYFVDNAGMPGRIVLRAGASIPSPGRDANGIEIQYTAGYGDAPEDVPAVLRHGMKQLIAYLYENRGDAPASALRLSGAETLFQPFRRMGLA